MFVINFTNMTNLLRRCEGKTQLKPAMMPKGPEEVKSKATNELVQRFVAYV